MNTKFWHGTWVNCPTSGLEVQGSSPCAGMKEELSIYVINRAIHVEHTPSTHQEDPQWTQPNYFWGPIPYLGTHPDTAPSRIHNGIQGRGMLYAMDTPSTPFAEVKEALMGFRIGVTAASDSPSYNGSNFLVTTPTSKLYLEPYPRIERTLPLRIMTPRVRPL